MFRTVVTLMLSTVLLSTTAHAKDRTEIKARKAQVKAAKQLSKQTNKLERKLDRMVKRDKTDKAATVRADLKALYKDELTRLRRRGMPTVAATVTHPAHADNPAATLRLDTGAPQMEALRDLIVGLKQSQPGSKAEGRQLDRLTEALEDRVDRKKAQLKAARKA